MVLRYRLRAILDGVQDLPVHLLQFIRASAISEKQKSAFHIRTASTAAAG